MKGLCSRIFNVHCGTVLIYTYLILFNDDAPQLPQIDTNQDYGDYGAVFDQAHRSLPLRRAEGSTSSR